MCAKRKIIIIKVSERGELKGNIRNFNWPDIEGLKDLKFVSKKKKIHYYEHRLQP